MTAPSQPWRLAADCPACGAALRLRRRREDAGLFLGCFRWPACRFAEDYDHTHTALLERIGDLEAERDELLDDLAANREGKGAAAALDLDLGRELRGLIALAHPDRWPENPLAHEVCSRLTALRARCAA